MPAENMAANIYKAKKEDEGMNTSASALEKEQEESKTGDETVVSNDNTVGGGK